MINLFKSQTPVGPPPSYGDSTIIKLLNIDQFMSLF
ncbi:uncharacterized protein METZ01_LOCUS428884 [marine metagenome]|uniref:Uncharacterized protein n=1 Tax=marine metagenome TaxID=408172 RepID=A0A382XYS2_9ZZZZ